MNQAWGRWVRGPGCRAVYAIGVMRGCEHSPSQWSRETTRGKRWVEGWQVFEDQGPVAIVGPACGSHFRMHYTPAAFYFAGSPALHPKHDFQAHFGSLPIEPNTSFSYSAPSEVGHGFSVMAYTCSGRLASIRMYMAHGHSGDKHTLPQQCIPNLPRPGAISKCCKEWV